MENVSSRSLHSPLAVMDNSVWRRGFLMQVAVAQSVVKLTSIRLTNGKGDDFCC
jgi:hypothetical protein